MEFMFASGSAETPRACLLGRPVAQSRSPMLHGYWLRTLGREGAYGLCDLGQDELPQFFATMRERGLVGCNVTAPHKEAVLPFLTRLDGAAQAVGAANTIWFEDGRLVGGNTDVYGLMASLDEGAPGWDAACDHVVLLGAGGAARAAVYGFRQRGKRVSLINRTLAKAQSLAAFFGADVAAYALADCDSVLASADLLVNTTSLGMLGKDPPELPLDRLKPSATVYDIVYVPLETAFLKAAKERGHRTVDGLGMLLHQGIPGFKLWFGGEPVVTRELRQLIEADIRAKTPGA